MGPAGQKSGLQGLGAGRTNGVQGARRNLLEPPPGGLTRLGVGEQRSGQGQDFSVP
jgi:hypothetical protein